jgi:hypothetical protein
MGFIDLPDPISMLEGAKTANLERDVVNALVSSAYSAWIAAMWRSGSAKWADWTGEGQAMKDAAVAMYLSLRVLEKKNFLALTVPQDMLTAPEISKFQTEEQTK